VTTFNLTIEDVEEILTEYKEDINNIDYVNKGGQKIVFKCNFSGEEYALKFCDVTDVKTDQSVYSLEEEEDSSSQSENVVLLRAKREIDIMHRVDTPTLVKLGPIDLNLVEYKDKKILFFSEEFIQGYNLRSLVMEKRLNFSQILQLGIDIANAIDHLWKIKMVHRDIKPENIMQRQDGDFVLLDTGIAFDIQGETLTAAYNFIGTPIYASPEQLSGFRRELDFRSDLFLLGIILYECITGSHPFFQRGLNTYQIVAKIASGNIVPPSQYINDLPKKFERIIMRLLAKEPHLRYKTCSQLIEQLSALREEL
jgi:eukaryotic-like serine/threonine-protein kinase